MYIGGLIMTTASVQSERKNKNHVVEATDYYLARMPLFSVETYKKLFSTVDGFEQAIEATLLDMKRMAQNPVIREAVAVASPSLYHSLEWLDTKSGKKKEQVLQSFVKYLIRMSTRPVPYGLFAGVTLGVFEDKQDIQMSERQVHKKRSRPDMEWLVKIIQRIESHEHVLKQLKVHINPLLYRSGSRVKLPYVTGYGLNKDDDINFNSSSFRLTPVVDFVLKEAQEPIQFNALFRKIVDQFRAPEEKVHAFLIELFQNECLISELRPSLMTANPLHYVLKKLNPIVGIDELKDNLNDISALINSYDAMLIGSGESQLLHLHKTMKAIEDVKDPLQVDMAISNSKISLNEQLKLNIEDAVNILWKMLPNGTGLNHLEKYSMEFLEKYGTEREVPLLELLDDEIGLGPPATYQHPPSNKEASTQALQEGKRERVLIQWLMKSMQQKQQEISLTDDMIENIASDDTDTKRVPDSFEVYFSTPPLNKSNEVETVILSNVSGSNGAGQSFGRFIDILPVDARSVLHQTQLQTRAAENDTIYAEIAYMPVRGRTTNVVLTTNLSDYEITLGANSSKPYEYTISVDDIVVCHDGHQIFLKSRSLGKRLAPKKTNMLNYMNGTPNVYRFLCEMSTFGEKAWRPFDWGRLSKSPFLPRITYKNIILSVAQWRLDQSIISFSKNCSDEDWYAYIKAWREEYNVSQFVYLVQFDHRLLLNLEHPFHLQELKREFIKHIERDGLLLTELGFNIEEDMQDEAAYLLECVLPFTKIPKSVHEPSHQPIDRKDYEVSRVQSVNERDELPFISDVDRLYFPGSEWLFVKFYSINSRQEEFLAFQLNEFIKYVQQNGWAEDCFFMRYRDPDPHIRLRFKGQPRVLLNELMPELYQWTMLLQEEGFVNRIVLDTYDPEIERYGGPELIQHAEHLFAADTEVVLNLIHLQRTGQLTIDEETLGVINVIHYLKHFIASFDEQLQWLNSQYAYNEYLKPFRKKRKQFMDSANYANHWESLRRTRDGQIIYEILQKRDIAAQTYWQAIQEVEQQGKLYNSRKNIIGSVIHLHLNRLIGVDRVKETKIMTLSRHTLHNLRYLITKTLVKQ